MNTAWSCVLVLVLAGQATSAAENPVFRDLIDDGVAMSDGSAVKLPTPLLADGLDASAQQAALAKLCDARTPLEEALRKSSSAPVVVKVRTVRASENESPSIRSVDIWFIAHGDWDTLNAKDFLESLAKRDDEGKSQIVTRSGILTAAEAADRQLAAANDEGREERFVYTTFILFDRVEVSATRFAVLTRGEDSVLAAAKIDPRFTEDADYPNQWRPLVRDELANIQLGPAQPYAYGGGYAKITRLKEPAGAVMVECHLVYEEPYAWFDGANLVKQKAPLMVQEKVRTFRRKLAVASEQGDK